MKRIQESNLKDNDRSAVQAAAAILRKGFPVQQIVLFGSKARGEDDRESDIDLLVLTSRQLSWAERDQLIDSLFDLELKWNVVITPLIASIQQWESGTYMVLPIRSEIERDGVAA